MIHYLQSSSYGSPLSVYPEFSLLVTVSRNWLFFKGKDEVEEKKHMAGDITSCRALG